MNLIKNALRVICIIGLITSVSCSYKRNITATNIQLDPIYGSNMVFKTGDSIIIKGVCDANGVLAVKLQDGLKYVYANETGKWQANFAPFNYKGSFSITLEGLDQVLELENLTIGKVWVVVGDNWLNDTPENIFENTEIEGRGANDNVRIYTPPSLYSDEKVTNGTWKILNVGKKKYREIFSGILGDELATYSDESIGIVNLSCPGSTIRDFSAQERTKASSVYTNIERDSILAQYFADQLKYQRLADSSFNGLEHEVLDRFYEDWDWSDVEFPLITKKRWYLKNRIAWLRKKIFISGKYITSDFIIELGTLRGQFDFYFNGTHIANFKGESPDYKLLVPDTLVKVWTNLLTIRMVAGDSLSGLYSEAPRVINTDSTYRMQIKEDWTIRTYYEPVLPEIRRNSLIWPNVYSNYILPLRGLNVNAVLLTGSIHQYANIDDTILTDALTELAYTFNSDKNYMYLIPSPEHIDAMVNDDYYNALRNLQLVCAVKTNWNIVNTLGIEESLSIQAFQKEMIDRLFNKITD